MVFKKMVRVQPCSLGVHAQASLLAVIVLVGAILRLWYLLATEAMIESDEAIVGLQAFGILRGEMPFFYPGQIFGSSFESYLVAGAIAMAGASPWTLKVVPFIFSMLFILASYWLGKEFYNPQLGLLSALFAALCPIPLLVLSLKAFGGYVETPVLGNIILILLGRILYGGEKSASRFYLPVLLGMTCGFAFWVNPQSFYYLIPAGLLLLVSRNLRNMALFAPAFALGTSPFFFGLFFAFSKDVALRQVSGGMVPLKDLWPSVKKAVSYFLTDTLPAIWGARPPEGPFPTGPLLIAIPICAVALGFEVWRLWRNRREERAWILGVTFLLSPFVFILGALNNGNFTAIIPDSGILNHYILPFYSFVLPLLAASIWRLWVNRRRSGLALTVLILGINLGGVMTTDMIEQTRSVFVNVPLPPSNRPLIEALEEEGIRHIYTFNWIGYVLIFETGERILAFDYVDSLYGMDCLPQYSQTVEKAQEAPAYVLFNPRWKRPPPLEKRLKEMGVSFEKKALEDFIIYYNLSRRVHPSEVRETLVWPYYDK